MAAPQTNDNQHICAGEKCSECQQQPLMGVELQSAEQHRAQCGRHCGAKRKPLIRRLVAACGKGLLWGIAIAFLWRTSRFLHRHPSPDWSYEEAILISEDPQNLSCVLAHNWTEYAHPPVWSIERFGAKTSFALPANADSLSLLARGSYQHGHVEFVQSTEESDTVDVNVRVAYRFEEAIENAAVCLTGNGKNEYGIGIFTPKRKGRWSGKEGLRFDIQVTLPAGKGGDGLNIKRLETELPNYSQNVADLWKTVSFDHIALSSVNGHVSVDSVTADTGLFTTSNGGISGHFNAESLELVTLNGPIRASVALLNRKGAHPSTLLMHTANGPIDSEVTLTSDVATGGKFDVDASTTNGPVDLKFIKSPVSALLKAKAKSTIGRVKVALAPEYEGYFSGSSVIRDVSLVNRNVEDPEGKGRRREHRAGQSVDGLSVFWVESDGSHAENESSVEASTTISAVEILV
ncbi:hypothetical protein SCLCIDRAFT_1217913 [Scleroderma citrinum Foug A]|uniref:DUF7330 domain-containing protein n=1 Tax=Scleroderma citrinum Foug A TaxID=1036808 RepID=A0A0C2ZBY3_9AGAM|nr:hypothetical protein SCLCIDRAFT_1217913 [Scleroderma citrinum Foug A]